MRHKVFVIFHHTNDQYYRNMFEEIFSNQYDLYEVQRWIHEAYERRNIITTNNSFPSFINNRSGLAWQR